jgi:hypothetical protein
MSWDPRLPPDAVRRPSCEVVAYPGTAKGSLIPPGGTRLTGLIERLRTTKTLQSPSGQFELSCTWEPPPGFAQSLGRVLLPGNIVEIALDAGLPDSTMEVVMRGWVGAIEESETLDGRGRPVRSISVSGEDCGRFFLRHDFGMYLFTAYTWGDKEMLERANKYITMGGACGAVLRQIFLAIFQDLTPILAVTEEGQLLTEGILDNPPGASLDDEDYWPASIQIEQAIWQANGKFWSIFNQYVDRPWNEAYGDYIPDPQRLLAQGYQLASPKGGMSSIAFPDVSTSRGTIYGSSLPGAGYYLIVRRTPFSKARWDALPKTVVFDSEVKLARTRISDDERVNLVIVHPFGSGYESLNDIPHQAADFRNLLRDKDSMARYGIQMQDARTIYWSIDSNPQDPQAQQKYAQKSDPMSQAIYNRTNALWRWHSINHLLRTGVMVIAGIPSIRIGERITGQGIDIPSAYFTDVEQVRQTFYVERVVQEYVDGSSYLTHLGLTRGQPPTNFITALQQDIELVVQALTNFATG